MTKTKEKNPVSLLAPMPLLTWSLQRSDEILNEIQKGETDSYGGKACSFVIDGGMDDFHDENFVCELKTDSGAIIQRTGKHTRFAGQSHFTFDEDNGIPLVTLHRPRSEESI